MPHKENTTETGAIKVYNAIVLNDTIAAPYATWMEKGLKTIETRWKTFKYRGDLVICCGAKSETENAGFALCVVNLYDAIPMLEKHELAAYVNAEPGRIAHLTNYRRLFSRKFKFSKQIVSGAFQSIFQITLPDDVKIYRPESCDADCPTGACFHPAHCQEINTKIHAE